MTLIESMVYASEIYSIDEIFCDLTGQPGDLTVLGRSIRERVLRCTGIPVGVGIAHTKTLAKLANHSKRLVKSSGQSKWSKYDQISQKSDSPVRIFGY
ncbi:hypothetical protein HBH25_22755 [Pseudomonas sp. hsmgli-8]|uniref:UmuC domain-containing protein n=1 Tax=Pseudomonas quercus TaxID=2722792 RepID=A0ABX0YNG8_9PSED|nr:hypothetical protein [Pseudomonas sp. LY10J]NJP03641.1 hypothetical protein [Pseudomonas quercus]